MSARQSARQFALLLCAHRTKETHMSVTTEKSTGDAGLLVIDTDMAAAVPGDVDKASQGRPGAIGFLGRGAARLREWHEGERRVGLRIILAPPSVWIGRPRLWLLKPPRRKGACRRSRRSPTASSTPGLLIGRPRWNWTGSVGLAS
jgi:hypothetical protein